MIDKLYTTEYEVRVQALDLATRYRDSTHDTLKRSKEYAAYLREGLEADRAGAEAERRSGRMSGFDALAKAELRNKPLTMGLCDGCINGMHPHTFRPCPERGCRCSVWDEQ